MNKPAIDGGAPLCGDLEWPEWPIHDNSETDAVVGVLESGKWWYGDRVAEFEEKFAAYQGARFGVSCTNGTAALRMGLAACGIGPGDEVIVPPYTFVATALAPLLLGAKPVFADIDIETANISPEAIADVVTDRTKAVMPVHFAGLPCDMESILSLSSRHGFRIIEDACHSWGTRVSGKGTGSIGDCGAFSFQMSKNMTAGEGGILITDDSEIASYARSYANCGRRESAPWYAHYIVSDNLRMTEIQAAILSIQLGRLDEHIRRRMENARIIEERLSSIPGLAVPRTPENVERRSYHLFHFRFLADRWTIDRAGFVEALSAEGIPCSTGYPIPLTRQPLFAGADESASEQCPGAERMCREAVWLPHALMLAPRDHIELLCDAVERIWNVRGSDSRKK